MKLNTLSKFLLIAHHPNKGRFLISDIHINYGIIGAALLEISLTGEIKIEEGQLILIKDKESDDPIISEILMEIRNSKKPRNIRFWMTKLTRKSRKYKWQILTDLERKKIIRIEKKKFLKLIPYKKSYLIDKKTRENLIDELRNIALVGNDLNEEDILVLSLVEACKMYKIITSNKEELKKLKIELKEVVKESAVNEIVDETTKQIQAVIIGGIIAATTATTVSSSN